MEPRISTEAEYENGFGDLATNFYMGSYYFQIAIHNFNVTVSFPETVTVINDYIKKYSRELLPSRTRKIGKLRASN